MGTEDWLARFQTALDRICPLQGLQRVLVGVSGGADSTALLLLLAELNKSLGRATMVEVLVGHVHHGLRGVAADLDEEFVRRLAAEHHFEFLCERGDAVEQARQRRLSPEAAARALRYGVFRRWASERGIDVVLLGHHSDDQAETVLLRAVRGAGIRGIAGIPESRSFSSEGGACRLVRPLLHWKRDSILRFLSERRQSYRSDASNADTKVPRNRIRHEVLPLLEEEVQPGAVASLARLAGIAREVVTDLEALGARVLAEARVPGPPGSICLSAKVLREWPPTIVRQTILAAIDAVGGDCAAEETQLADSAYRSLLAWLGGGVPSRFGVEARRGGQVISLQLRYGVMRVTPASQLGGEVVPEALVVPASPESVRVEWLDWMLELEETESLPPAHRGSSRPQDGMLAETHFEEWVDADRVREAGVLQVRSRRKGDRFWPLGCPGRKSLKEFFRQERVWPSDRDRVPLLVAGDNLVWVVGCRIGHRFRLRPATQNTLRLRASRLA